LSEAGYLLDINVLVALIDDSHIHHGLVASWFDSIHGQNWGVCVLTEAGFLRVITGPSTGCLTLPQATEVLEKLSAELGYRFWPVSDGWPVLTAPFKARIFGHQQITDALLLGLAVKQSGVLVTLDQAIAHLAGASFAANILVLQ
jgi:uncharacterized protein